MVYVPLPEKPEATDYQVAEDIVTDVMHDFMRLHEESTDPTEQARLQRQVGLYFKERDNITVRPSAYQRARTYHRYLRIQIGNGSAIEDGRLKRPFRYDKAKVALPDTPKL